MFDAYTDYPITELGDIENERAPIRKCKILTYDRDKYADVMVFFQDEDGDERVVITNFKAGYIYKNKVRYDDGIQFTYHQFTYDELITLPWTY
jgi:hypothetical protein